MTLRSLTVCPGACPLINCVNKSLKKSNLLQKLTGASRIIERDRMCDDTVTVEIL